MPDYATINRIAQILAGAISSEPAEAQVKLQGAYKRMVRDNVSITDLLTLPKTALFQSTLVKLVDLILSEQHDLSPAGKREAYEHYMLLIVAKFSGGWDGQSEAGQGSRQDDDREAAAREYEERRKAEEASRERAQSQTRGGSQQGENSRGAGEGRGGWQSTQNQSYASGHSGTVRSNRIFNWKVGKYTFSFSTAPAMSALQTLFGRESISWHTFRDPGRGLCLFAVSILWGMGFALALLLLAALAHAITNTGPLWDVQLKNIFALLSAIGTIGKARALFLAGWFR